MFSAHGRRGSPYAERKQVRRESITSEEHIREHTRHFGVLCAKHTNKKGVHMFEATKREGVHMFVQSTQEI